MIKINIKAKNFELTDAIRDYLTKKIELLDAKFMENDPSASCDAEVGKISEHHKSGDIFRAELNLHVAGENLYAAVEKDNLYAAIDKVKDEMGKSLSRKKKLRQLKIRKGGAVIKRIIKGLRW